MTDPEPNASTHPRVRIVAVAASAGGVKALQALVSQLPADLPVPVVVVQHLDPHQRSLMVDILRRRTPLAVTFAADQVQLAAGTVYVAPPDQHVLVNADGTLSLTHTELVHFVRPSADLLFDSAAAAYGPGVVAVVLTGTGEDGALGVEAVKRMGGSVIVQDEASCEYFGMPAAAIATGAVDLVAPLDEIAGALVTLMTTEELS